MLRKNNILATLAFGICTTCFCANNNSARADECWDIMISASKDVYTCTNVTEDVTLEKIKDALKCAAKVKVDAKTNCKAKKACHWGDKSGIWGCFPSGLK